MRPASLYAWLRGGGGRLVRASLRALARDPEFLSYPTVGLALALVLWPVGVVAAWTLAALLAPTNGTIATLTFLVALAPTFALHAAAQSFLSAGVVASAMTRFRGGESTFWTGWRALARHRATLARWALVDGLIRLGPPFTPKDRAETRPARLFGGVHNPRGALYWTAASYLGTAFIVDKGLSRADAQQASIDAVRGAGGTRFVYGLNLRPLAFTVSALVVFAWVIRLFVLTGGSDGETTVIGGRDALLLFGPPVALVLAVGVTRAAAEAVLQAAAYVTVVDGRPPAGFDAPLVAPPTSFTPDEELAHAKT